MMERESENSGCVWRILILQMNESVKGGDSEVLKKVLKNIRDRR